MMKSVKRDEPHFVDLLRDDDIFLQHEIATCAEVSNEKCRIDRSFDALIFSFTGIIIIIMPVSIFMLTFSLQLFADYKMHC